MKILFFVLFLLGALFLNASHIPAWLLGSEKPSREHWKTYGIIGIAIWILILILANTVL